MASFDDVYLVEQHRAYKLAYLLCGDPLTAEDAVAEAFASVWPRWQRGDVADVGTYLRRAVVNQVISGFRRRELERRERARHRVKQRPRGTEEAAADRQLLLGALSRLPPRQRAAIVLRYFEDLTEADIALAMGTSVGTTKAHLSRGLATLRQILDNSGETL